MTLTLTRPADLENSKTTFSIAGAALMAFIWLATSTSPALAEDPGRWWKGNLHTHSLWSDGDDYPEMITEWYRDQGYHFLMLSDHNVLSQGEKWVDLAKNAGGEKAYLAYLKRFGPGWVNTRETKGRLQIRLKPLSEFRGLYEVEDEFLMIQGEEITAYFLPGPNQSTVPIHINATHLKELVVPQSGRSVEDVLRKNVRAVLEQRARTKQAMFPHLNHPNFHYAVTAEDLARVTEERFFEVYNGHPAVNNVGDALHAGTERLWDIVLTRRLAEMDAAPVYGLATDDGHNYHEQATNRSNAGRGWVMVRAEKLTPEHLIKAMEAGDFYASTGVVLREITQGNREYALEIEPEPGIRYQTQFIGTRQGYDSESKPVRDASGAAIRATRRYSRDVGEVLADIEGLNPVYRLKGDEIYVRARVVSSKPMDNPGRAGDMETAWGQPWIP